MPIINIYPEIEFEKLDIHRNMRVTTDIKSQIRNVVLSRLLDEYWYEPTYGVKVHKLLLRSDPQTYGSIAKRCENEILKDDRISDCSVVISQPDSNSTVNIFVTVTPVNSNQNVQIVINNIQTK